MSPKQTLQLLAGRAVNVLQLNWNLHLMFHQSAEQLTLVLRPGLYHCCLANLISPWPFDRDREMSAIKTLMFPV